MRLVGFAASIVVAAMTATSASAITFPTQADMDSHLASTLFTGVGVLATVSSAGAAFSCTATLISSNVVLTAAHCLHDDSSYKFVLPGAGEDGLQTGTVYDIKSSVALDSFSGTGVSDIGLITLGEAVTGDHQVYDLYQGQTVGQQFTMVGAGISGLEGDNIRANADYTGFLGAGVLRWGTNEFDVSGTALGLASDTLLMDNDDGTAEHDLFGRLLGIHDTGVVVDGVVQDDGILYGDSGGPDFINGMIAAINVGGSSGAGLFGETCGTPGSVSPVPPGLLGCVNGGYGDFGVSLSVADYAGAINAYVAAAAAAAIPEPASWALMILGFAGVGMSVRKRQHLSVRAA